MYVFGTILLIQTALAHGQCNTGTLTGNGELYSSQICTQPAFPEYQYTTYDPYTTGYAYYTPSSYSYSQPLAYTYAAPDSYYRYAQESDPTIYREIPESISCSSCKGKTPCNNVRKQCDERGSSRSCNCKQDGSSYQSEKCTGCRRREPEFKDIHFEDCDCCERKNQGCGYRNDRKMKCICICDEIRDTEECRSCGCRSRCDDNRDSRYCECESPRYECKCQCSSRQCDFH